MTNRLAVILIIVSVTIVITQIVFDLQAYLYPFLARTLVAVASLAIWYFIFYLIREKKNKNENHNSPY